MEKKTKVVIKRALAFASGSVNLITDFLPKTPTAKMIAAAIHVSDQAVKHFEDRNAWVHFQHWHQIENNLDYTLLSSLVEYIRKNNSLEPVFSKYGADCYEIELYGSHYGWIMEDNDFRSLYSKSKTKIDSFQMNVGRYIWESSQYCISVDLKISPNQFNTFNINKDILSDCKSSEKSVSIADKVKKFINKKVSVSFMLAGQPGTGKSYIIRDVSQKLGLNSLRIKPNQFHSASALLDFILFLKPDVLLIDDMDRSEEMNSVLEYFESLKQEVSVILATCNSLNNFDPAILRAGRFDFIEVVETLDKKTLDTMLKVLPKTIRKRASKLPVAYINQLVEIVEVLGPEEALKSIEALIKRKKMVCNQDFSS